MCVVCVHVCVHLCASDCLCVSKREGEAEVMSECVGLLKSLFLHSLRPLPLLLTPSLSSTRYLYFLQLKHLILNGDLQCSHDIAVKLASYALQGMAHAVGPRYGLSCTVYSLF